MNATLSLQLIGTPEVRLGPTPLRFQRRRSLALLAYLVLTAREHPREALATLLAGEADPQAARHILRVALAELRAQLGDDLRITRQTVAFAPSRPVELDVTAVQAALASGDVAAMQVALNRADGELLAGLSLSQAPTSRAGWRSKVSCSCRMHHLACGDRSAISQLFFVFRSASEKRKTKRRKSTAANDHIWSPRKSCQLGNPHSTLLLQYAKGLEAGATWNWRDHGDRHGP